MEDNTTKYFRFTKRYQRLFVLLMVLGLLAAAIGGLVNPERTWVSFLLNSVYFITLSVSGLFFLAIQHVAGARWHDVLRRLPEAISSYIPIGGVILLVLFFGMHSIYHWTHHDAVLHDKILAGKAAYLNTGFFFVRMVIIVAVWTFFAKLIRKNSLMQDSTGDYSYYKRNIRNSVFFLFSFAVTFSVASFDWLMSVDPHWYSTIFAIYNFSGMFVNGLAVISIMAVVLKQKKVLTEINENHFHDLGKLLMAFVAFWAYIWYSQFVLIWYGNIPEETVYFVNRLKGDWSWLFYTNVVINFVIPFFILLPRATKRSGPILMRVCILLLVGRWLDLYLMIAPGSLDASAYIGIIEIAMSFGFMGLFLYVVSKSLSEASLLPTKSPILEESLHYHQ